MRHQISRGLIPTVGLLLIACGSSASDGGTGTQDGAASSDVVTPSDTGGASDGGATDTAGRGTDGVLPSDAPEPDAVNDDTPDMVGPAACVPVAGDPGLVRLRGTVFTGEALIPDGEVFISRSSQSILCVGVDCSTHPDAAGATVLCTDGVITPGIIDPHNHVQYDHLPRWKHTQLFKDRYEWQVDNGYKAFKAPQVETDGKAGCEAMKHGELRLLVGGTTSVQGTKNPGACINILVRDIDSSASASGLPGAPIKDSIPKIANLSAADAKAIAENLAGGKIRAFVAHIAEGVNEAALAEWTALKDKGLAVAGTSLIHANGLDGAALAEAAAAGVDLIWSPQSNLDLYGQTALIPTAVNLGMNIAIGPDWTLSGSMTPIEELKCARQLSQKRYGGLLTDEQLVQMVTINAARSLGLDDLIGRLASGLLADVAVFAGDRSKPFDAVISSRPETVRLVFVAGQALYGDQDLMTQVGDGDCEDYSACGVAKRLCLVESGPGAVEKSDQKLANVQATLQGVLDGAKANSTCAATAEGCYAYLLNPLHKCGADADALVQCDPKGAGTVEPSADDTDGDGKPNASDNCPTVFNVDQGDQDADAAGDACDPCPTQANSTACNKPSPADLDGDGRRTPRIIARRSSTWTRQTRTPTALAMRATRVRSRTRADPLVRQTYTTSRSSTVPTATARTSRSRGCASRP